MKTAAKNFTTFGNIGIVQVSSEPETLFSYRPGTPELLSGGLLITETTEGGVVGMLKAVNRTKSFLLLTDADVLTGAKQNRILNRSILLPPLSETVIDVSCIERLRWNYTGKNFSNPGSVADPDLRKEKASSVISGEPTGTQQRVWSHVSKKLRDKRMENATESYAGYLADAMQSAPVFPECEAHQECTGIVVLLGNKAICADLFGNREAYRYYFPYLRDSAFRMASSMKEKPIDIHEAFYRSLEALDNFLVAKKSSEADYKGAGDFGIVESTCFVGFDLRMKGEIIHDVFFMK